MRRMVVACSWAAVVLSGCSTHAAQIVVAPQLAASTERLELTGMGAGRNGDFQLGQSIGTFTRSADRLGIFDPLLVKHRGGGAFRLRELPGGSELAGRCSYRENVVNAGPVSVTRNRLAYYCDFARDGHPINATLVVVDPRPQLGTLHGRDERTGTLVYQGQVINLRSIHRFVGGGLPTPAALGYSFSVDGREIGAVDLNGLNKSLFVPRSGAQREAVIMGSVALATFWDPAVVGQD